MLSSRELRAIAHARLKDAEVLLKAKRFDGAVYLCGYAVELKIKARICKHLRWQGFPQSNKEFDKLHSFKTHDLDILLKLSGIELKIRSGYLVQWSTVLDWDPEARYRPIGSAVEQDAIDMIEATKVLLGVIA